MKVLNGYADLSITGGCKVNRFIRDMKKYWNYTFYSAKSQLKTEVANSYLNWLWWILEPFCFMMIYALVFGFLFPHKQDYFNIFIFLGLAYWDFFNRCVKSAVRMVKRNKPVVAKVYLPKYTLIVSDMMVNGFKMLICFGIVALMLLFYRVPLTWNILLIIPITCIMILFTFGCCCILLHLGVFIDDMSNVINIVLRFIFYLTGIFYNIEVSFKGIYGSLLLHLNPLACFITNARRCVIYGQMPDFGTLGIWLAISIVLCVFGVWNIYRSENTYVKVI